MHGGLQGTGLLLLTAVAGYWVLERAEGHRGTLRRTGRLVAWVVMLASFAGLVCSALACASAGKDGWCPFSKKGGFHYERRMGPGPEAVPE